MAPGLLLAVSDEPDFILHLVQEINSYSGPAMFNPPDFSGWVLSRMRDLENARGDRAFPVVFAASSAQATGYMVSTREEDEERFDVRWLAANPDVVRDFNQSVESELAGGANLGAWYDDGFLYLDVIRQFEDEVEAIKAGFAARKRFYFALFGGASADQPMRLDCSSAVAANDYPARASLIEPVFMGRSAEIRAGHEVRLIWLIR